MTLLAVENLSVSFATRRGTVRAVDRVAFQLECDSCFAQAVETRFGRSICWLWRRQALICGELDPQRKRIGRSLVLPQRQVAQAGSFTFDCDTSVDRCIDFAGEAVKRLRVEVVWLCAD